MYIYIYYSLHSPPLETWAFCPTAKWGAKHSPFSIGNQTEGNHHVD